MSVTPRLNLTRAVEGQSGGEILFNSALNALDTIANMRIADRDLSTPPGSPSDGDVYLVAPTGTGAWAGHDDEVAYYFSGWYFITPYEGMRAWVMDEALFIIYNGASWTNLSGGIYETSWAPPSPGQYTSGLFDVSPSSAAGFSADTLYAMPFIIPTSFTAVAVTLGCGTGAGNARIGVYNDDGAGRPSSLIEGSGSFSLTTSTLHEYTFASPILFTPGRYWFSCVLSSTPSLQRFSYTSGLVQGVGKVTIGGSISPVMFIKRSFTFGTLPDPWGTAGALSSSDIAPPQMFLKA